MPKTYLIVQNSVGRKAGDGGHHYFSPTVMDQAANRYGIYFFVDADPEEMKKKLWPFWLQWWERIKKYIRKLFK